MVAEVSYVFNDALTGEIIQEIPLQGVSSKSSLDGGEFRGTLGFDISGKDNSTLEAATIPGRCCVTVERDGVVVGDYLLWTRTYQSQAKSCQLYGIAIKEYTETRVILVDYSATAVEQRNIMIDLYDLMQADPNAIKVELPPAFSTEVAKTVTVSGDELKTYRQVIDSFADTVDGFDWLVRTVREGNRYRRWLDIGYPQIGTFNTTSGIPVFEYFDTEDGSGGNINNYWINDSMGSAATHFYGIGSGEGSEMITAEFVHTGLLAGGFPRYDTTVDQKDISSQTLLAGVTSQQAHLFKAPMSIFTLEVKADTEPVFGGYGLGDLCQIQIQDARFPAGLTKQSRVLGWEHYPPSSDRVEEVRLTFEGEDQEL